MKLHSAVIDSFLDDFRTFRMFADEAHYTDVTNPVDGVVYPGICTDIPVAEEVQKKLSALMCWPVTINTLFMRLSLKGVPVPHQAHTDATMGNFSLMLYLNRPEHCEGGTALVKHVATGLDKNPETEFEEALWKRDTNVPEKWTTAFLCSMKANRAFVFRAELMHCAFPLGGFGKSAYDGRLVLTAFYS